MAVVISKPGIDELGEVVGTLREWQDDAAPVQLHPGDDRRYLHVGRF